MPTSRKHRDFRAEPVGEKPVGSPAGMGEVPCKELEERGFDEACVVLGQFLVLRKDENLFPEWPKDSWCQRQAVPGLGMPPRACDAFL
uniref:Barrier-to-autointegration factor n=1 Tax=Piliocolobus tephrosceles TaxID=591936 RepID=A0A8C9LS05_9PRIM